MIFYSEKSLLVGNYGVEKYIQMKSIFSSISELKTFYFPYHCEINVQLGYNSGHIGIPFSPHFYPPRSEYPAPLHLMWPRIDIQTILGPLWACYENMLIFS